MPAPRRPHLFTAVEDLDAVIELAAAVKSKEDRKAIGDRSTSAGATFFVVMAIDRHDNFEALGSARTAASGAVPVLTSDKSRPIRVWWAGATSPS